LSDDHSLPADLSADAALVAEAEAPRADQRREGVVAAQLPSGLYQVEIDGHRVTVHIGGGLERNFVRLLVGDRVMVELAPRDRTRGRVVRKL
jgi:translation initiation factor IF-1